MQPLSSKVVNSKNRVVYIFWVFSKNNNWRLHCVSQINSSLQMSTISVFKKDVTYDNIKSHKKPGFHPLFRRYIF